MCLSTNTVALLLLCYLCLCCVSAAFTPLLSQHISCTFRRAKVSGVLVGGVSVWWGGTGGRVGGGRCGRRVRGGGATLKGGVRVAIDVARQVGRRGRSVRGVRLVWSALLWGAASGGRWGFLSRVQGVAATQGPPSDPVPALRPCRWAAGLHRLPPPQPPAVWVHLVGAGPPGGGPRGASLGLLDSGLGRLGSPAVGVIVQPEPLDERVSQSSFGYRQQSDWLVIRRESRRFLQSSQDLRVLATELVGAVQRRPLPLVPQAG